MYESNFVWMIHVLPNYFTDKLRVFKSATTCDSAMCGLSPKDNETSSWAFASRLERPVLGKSRTLPNSLNFSLLTTVCEIRVRSGCFVK